jgi:hypothetical protein
MREGEVTACEHTCRVHGIMIVYAASSENMWHVHRILHAGLEHTTAATVAPAEQSVHACIVVAYFPHLVPGCDVLMAQTRMRRTLGAVATVFTRALSLRRLWMSMVSTLRLRRMPVRMTSRDAWTKPRTPRPVHLIEVSWHVNPPVDHNLACTSSQ